MTTDVLGSGAFKLPFNKTSSAVRPTGSAMQGSPLKISPLLLQSHVLWFPQESRYYPVGFI